jgi:predicted anti-sigma-YlaC factor YlaD
VQAAARQPAGVSGNRHSRRGDYWGMDCATAREGISAILDGEDPGAGPDEVEAHLAQCAACRAWREAAHHVTRRARLQPAHPGPSRAAEVLAAVPARTPATRRPGRAGLARASLAGIAAAQLALTIPCLLLGQDHSAPEHIAHEAGSFGAALTAGFLVAAWRPQRALGMRALVGVAAMLLLLTAVADLAAGRTNLGDETPHLLAVAGWLLVCYLAAATPPTAEGPRPAVGSRPWFWFRMPFADRLRPPAAAVPAAGLTAGAADQPAAGGQHRPGHSAAARGCVTAHCDCQAAPEPAGPPAQAGLIPAPTPVAISAGRRHT